MFRSLLAVALAGLVIAPAALADGGPSPGAMQGWTGVTSPNGAVRYVAFGTGSKTILSVIRRRGGSVARFNQIDGDWGVPVVAWNGDADGLSRDGRMLVLAELAQSPQLRPRSSFLIVETRRLLARDEITLQGDFSFDALSPDGRTLYLIQHVDTREPTRYVVRSYDLEHHRLNDGRIADKTQRSWVMAGRPVSRVTSADGRWAYTLYQRDGGYPFVHALDTVRGVAHCIGLAWTGSQDALWKLRMSVHDGELALAWPRGKTYATIDTRTFRVSRPGTSDDSGAAWWGIGGAGGALLLLGVLVVGRARRRPPLTAAQPT